MKSCCLFQRFIWLVALATVAACGGGGGAEQSPGQPAAAGPTLELLAGTSGGLGYFDGPAATAKFRLPTGLAVDSAGNVYVGESGNRVIRKITPAGVVTTLAGSATEGGFVDGPADVARFGDVGLSQNPSLQVAVDAQANVYVADTYNNSIRKVTPSGVVTTMAGTGARGAADGPGSTATFSSPYGIAVDGLGNVYVGDSGNATIRKITPNRTVTTVAGVAGERGYVDGRGPDARFTIIGSLAADAMGNVYIADAGQHVLRKLSPDGMVSTMAGPPGITGRVDGNGNTLGPGLIATDSSGNVLVIDGGTVRRVSPSGAVTSLVLSESQAACPQPHPGLLATMDYATALAIAPSGTIYFGDDRSSVIRSISPAGEVTTFAGNPLNLCAPSDGAGTQARFSFISAMALSPDGSLLLVDVRSIRKVTAAGQVTTLAAAALPYTSIAIAATGAVYLGEHQFPSLCRLGIPCNYSGSIRQMGSNGEMPVVSAVANSDQSGTQINTVVGLSVGPGGDLFWADFDAHVIRKLSAGGDMTTLAGSRGAAGASDGTGPAARFRYPSGLAVDAQGTVFVADTDNHTIRMISPTGAVTTIAGSAGAPGSSDGNGAAARFRSPRALALDEAGNLYVADTGNCLVRKLSRSGAVTTVAGSVGRCGFAAGPAPGSIDVPASLAIRGSDLYIAMQYGIAVLRNRP